MRILVETIFIALNTPHRINCDNFFFLTLFTQNQFFNRSISSWSCSFRVFFSFDWIFAKYLHLWEHTFDQIQRNYISIITQILPIVLLFCQSKTHKSKPVLNARNKYFWSLHGQKYFTSIPKSHTQRCSYTVIKHRHTHNRPIYCIHLAILRAESNSKKKHTELFIHVITAKLAFVNRFSWSCFEGVYVISCCALFSFFAGFWLKIRVCVFFFVPFKFHRLTIGFLSASRIDTHIIYFIVILFVYVIQYER